MNTTGGIIVPITQARGKLGDLAKQAENGHYIILTKGGLPKAVLLNYAYHQALEESYQDYLDVLEYDQTIGLKRIPLSTHKRNRAK